ncbi:MAG: septum formation initiator family protein [Candidatus Babeliales bacterium]|jgi:cell division protein FtsB
MDHNSFIRNATLISVAVVIGAYLIFGSRGMLEYYKKRLLVLRKQEKIAHLEKEVIQLSGTSEAYRHHPFSLEKSARYDFCMGYTNEMVYVVPPKTSS